MDNKKTKDSGIEWIGEIPEDWGIVELSKVSRIITGGTPPKNSANNYYNENGILWVKPNDLSGLKDIKQTKEYLSEEGSKFVTIVEPLTPLVCCIGTIGKIGFSLNKVTFNQQINAVVFNSNIVLKKYGLYSLIGQEKQHEYFANGNVVKIINSTNQGKILIALPPQSTQHQIADFLDKKCSQIDELIANNQSQIDKLKEYKQSVITQAVTKGLDPNVETKDSGIDWIGQIPKNWKVISLKALFNFGKGLPITKADLIPNGVKVISYGQIHAKYNNIVFINDKMIRFVDENYLLSNSNSLVEKNDFIFADTSEDLEGAGDFIFIDKDDTIFAGYHTIVLKHKQNKSNKFLAYLFMSYQWKNQIRSRVTGIKVFSISRGILSKASVILPPEEAQHQIADYLDKKCSQIDSLIEIKQQKIEKLQEYKKSLIYEYVTGKKEVG